MLNGWENSLMKRVTMLQVGTFMKNLSEKIGVEAWFQADAEARR
jgi:hypothetical protein